MQNLNNQGGKQAKTGIFSIFRTNGYEVKKIAILSASKVSKAADYHRFYPYFYDDENG